jgi:FkbM family methyltransferase
MISHAQYGEDAILEGIISRLEWVTGDGFNQKTYIDIGGFHPEIHSVFYHFYKERRWRGSIYEPNRIHNDDFRWLRSEDKLHNIAVAGQAGIADFRIFSEGDSSNTISEKFADEKESAQGTPVARIEKVECITLNDAMDKHIDDFGLEPLVVSIDAEGSDFDIMAHYDFEVRPPFFLIENDPGSVWRQTPLNHLMLNQDYRPVAATVMTTLFLDSTSYYKEAIGKIGQR